MVDLPSSPLADIDPDFEKMALETGGLTYQLTGTSTREKLLQNLANDVCRLQLGLAFRLHLMAAKMHGIPHADLLALIRFVAPYAGYPAAADALRHLQQVAIEVGMDAGEPGEHAVPDGDQPPAESADVTDQWMTGFLHSRIARAWSENRLSRREKAIIALTTDVSQLCLADSFRLHIKLALEAGASKEDVRDVIRFCAEMGVAKAVAAQRELETALTHL